jgi:hypothetical protein
MTDGAPMPVALTRNSHTGHDLRRRRPERGALHRFSALSWRTGRLDPTQIMASMRIAG